MTHITLIVVGTVKTVEGCVGLAAWMSHLLVFARMVLTPPLIVLEEVSSSSLLVL